MRKCRRYSLQIWKNNKVMQDQKYFLNDFLSKSMTMSKNIVKKSTKKIKKKIKEFTANCYYSGDI